jgi:acetyltransferase-like isoleucine patch superfamily enzyme
VGEAVYLDSAYSFAAFHSTQDPGLVLGDAAGVYDRATLVVGLRGRVRVGSYTVLNGTYLVCDERITIGSHCLLSWGVVITDSWCAAGISAAARRSLLEAAAAGPRRHFPSAGSPRPVTLEDNVWVGFDSVILPGVTLGRGCIVGSRTIVADDVAPYAVVVGDPARVVRYLDADDTPEARQAILLQHGRR